MAYNNLFCSFTLCKNANTGSENKIFCTRKAITVVLPDKQSKKKKKKLNLYRPQKQSSGTG